MLHDGWMNLMLCPLVMLCAGCIGVVSSSIRLLTTWYIMVALACNRRVWRLSRAAQYVEGPKLGVLVTSSVVNTNENCLLRISAFSDGVE